MELSVSNWMEARMKQRCNAMGRKLVDVAAKGNWRPKWARDSRNFGGARAARRRNGQQANIRQGKT